MDQPVAKRRRLEPVDLESVADRNLGEKRPSAERNNFAVEASRVRAWTELGRSTLRPA